MKSAFCIAVLYLSFIFFCISCKEQKPPKKSKYDNMAGLMEQEFQMARDPYLNVVPTERLLEAQQIRDEILEVAESLKAPVPGISWQERGPNNVGGRTRVLWFDRNDAANGYKKVWAAGVGGGLWSTNDITVTTPVWNKVDDMLENLAICAFAQDPTNPQIMYFGTGEGYFNSDAMQGVGIWKTTNGGSTWTRLPSTTTFYYVQDLLVDSHGNLLTTLRSNNSGSGARGVQRSTDGGNTWTQVLAMPDASSDRAADLELASNGDIYVSVGINFQPGGIYRSSYAANTTNTGNTGTWINITPDASNVISTPGNWWARIELACAPSNPDIVYALFTGYGNNNCIAIKQYDASTNSWVSRTVPTIIDQGSNSNFTRAQGFYDLIAAVHPTNAASLYIGGVDALRSDDSAKTWTQMTTWSLFSAAGFTSAQNVHADHHAIVYAPGSTSRVLWGTDGGIYYTENANISGTGNKPSFVAKNIGYNVTQFYAVAVHPSSTNFFLAGAQDNGTHRFGTSGLGNTTEVTGGDGAFCFIDQDNPSIQITSYVYNNFFVSTNTGSSFVSVPLNNRGQFINPAEYVSADNILYSGDDPGYYHRWTNPHNVGLGTDVRQQVAVTALGTSRISHISASPSTAGRIYLGTTNGTVVRVDDATTGTTKAGTVLRTSTGYVSCVVVDPNNEDHIVVTYSSYGVTSIYETYNASAGTPTWTAIEGNLPDMPIRWAMFDPRNSDWMILATELGIWSTNNLNGSSTEWTTTNTGFANTRVDMIRYRTSDRTLVAATHGRGLFTAVIPSSTTPDINFSIATLAAAEQEASIDGCRKFRDYSINMTIANAPTGDAVVTIGVTGATATAGSDYELTTNGNFSATSNTTTFSNGATDSKTITLRVYDDLEVEAAESITLNYSISGSTNAQAGTGAQTVAVSITDNDVAPQSFNTSVHSIGTVQYILGNSGDAQLFDAELSGKKTLMLYRASELSAQGVTAGMISSIAFNLQKNSSRPYENLQISMGTTSLQNLVSGGSYTAPAVTQVMSLSSYNTVSGWNTFNLDVPFSWNGTDNILIQLCYTNAAVNATQLGDPALGYADSPGGSTGNMIWQNIGCSVGYGSVTANSQGIKPIIQIGRTVAGTSVATTLTSRNEYFPALSDYYLYNGVGEIMARVRNLSSTHNYGCTEFRVDRSGTSATEFWNPNPANQLMDKTFRILPANNNPSGSIEITLYYTQAEVDGWEAATGQSFNNIQLVKTEGRVGDVTPSNPDAAGDVTVVTPVVGTFGSNRTLTFTFTTGFSGFAAGIVGSALPIRLIDFTGTYKNQQVLLNWKTSLEINSKGFDIERSIDGQQFVKIGYVAAAGNSSTTRLYQFADKLPLSKGAYYRLKQIDLDNHFEYSKIVAIQENGFNNNSMSIVQNPVKQHIDLIIPGTDFGKASAQLATITGQVISRWDDVRIASSRARLSIEGRSITPGIYVLTVRSNGKQYAQRVVKQ